MDLDFGMWNKIKFGGLKSGIWIIYFKKKDFGLRIEMKCLQLD